MSYHLKAYRKGVFLFNLLTGEAMSVKVYMAIIAVQRALNEAGGIGKNQDNKQQGWKFRGIDGVYSAISPKLNEANLCILPRVISHKIAERTTAKGTIMYHVTLEVEFDFVSAEDGSIHTIKTIGEAMDTGDKASNKAMSIAYKYACFQVFAIPTTNGKNNDPDFTTPEETISKIKLPVAPPQRRGNASAKPEAPQTTEKPALPPLSLPKTQSNGVLALCTHISTLDDKNLFITYMTHDMPRKKLTPLEKKEVFDFSLRKGQRLGLKCVNKLWTEQQDTTQ